MTVLGQNVNSYHDLSTPSTYQPSFFLSFSLFSLSLSLSLFSLSLSFLFSSLFLFSPLSSLLSPFLPFSDLFSLSLYSLLLTPFLSLSLSLSLIHKKKKIERREGFKTFYTPPEGGTSFVELIDRSFCLLFGCLFCLKRDWEDFFFEKEFNLINFEFHLILILLKCFNYFRISSRFPEMRVRFTSPHPKVFYFFKEEERVRMRKKKEKEKERKRKRNNKNN